MALRSVARLYSLCPHASSSMGAACLVSKRSMALDGLKGYGDREAAQENVYFHKEDEKLLRSLLTKVKVQAEKTLTPAEAEKAKESELAPLKSLLDKYKISDADKEALLEWKHTS